MGLDGIAMMMTCAAGQELLGLPWVHLVEQFSIDSMNGGTGYFNTAGALLKLQTLPRVHRS